MILENLYRGQFAPLEQVPPTDPAYLSAINEADEMLTKLSKMVSTEVYSMIESMTQCLATAQLLETEAYYKLGFASGLTLQKECEEQLQVFHT